MGDMDSGNSGSMQSSSTGGGGDEQEYESRGESSSFPAFFNPASNYPVNPFDNARLLQLYSLNNGSSSLNAFNQHHQQQQQIISSCGNLDSLQAPNFVAQSTASNNNSSSSNLEMAWAVHKFGSINRSPPSDDATCTITPPQPQLGQPTTTGPPNPNPNQNPNPTSGGSGGGGPGGKNPKKRSRASRRAPTTVLTTDTSNFRQMVQEFTGIPAPPFSTFPARTRLDLFAGLGMGLGMGMGMSSGTGMGLSPGGTCNLDPPSFLLRPSPQKLHHGTAVNNTPATLPEAAPPSSSTGAANTNNPMFAFQPGMQNPEPKTTGTGPGSAGGPRGEGDPPSWAGLHQGLGLNQAAHDRHLTVSGNQGGVGNFSSGTANTMNPPRGAAVLSSSDSHGGGGGGGGVRGEPVMVDSWICSSD